MWCWKSMLEVAAPDNDVCWFLVFFMISHSLMSLLLAFHVSFPEIAECWFLIWLMCQHSFFKQFYGSVTRTDYTALRLGFIMVCAKVLNSRFLCSNMYYSSLHLCANSLHSSRILLQTHCRGNPKFDFHKYMIRALEADFKTVVGIRYLFEENF